MKKKWVLSVLAGFLSITLILGGLTYYVDPYFHFHKPFPGVSYTLGNYVYQNDGIAKHFEYNAIVTGTSMTEHFSTEEIDALFGVNSVRMTFLGEGFRRINDNLTTAFASKNDIDLVLWGIDPIWFVCDENFLEYGTYDEYPTYLYDDDPLNDFQYLFNADILKTDVKTVLSRSLQNTPHDEFDSFDKNAQGSAQLVKEHYNRIPKEILTPTEEETDMMMENLKRNIAQNVTSTIEAHPDTTFIIFFPPYSLVFWDDLMQNGTAIVERRYLFEEYVIQTLLSYDNVKLYSFLDAFDRTTNLDNYIDDLHYIPEYNSYMLKCFVSGDHLLTGDNWEEYLERSKEFYLDYDYDSVFGNQ